MKKSDSTDEQSASELIDQRIAGYEDWRGQTLGIMRKLVLDADPDVVEEVKWRKPSNSMLGIPVWSHDGIICTGEAYKDKVKLDPSVTSTASAVIRANSSIRAWRGTCGARSTSMRVRR